MAGVKAAELIVICFMLLQGKARKHFINTFHNKESDSNVLIYFLHSRNTLHIFTNVWRIY